jgi:hypothetical protein
MTVPRKWIGAVMLVAVLVGLASPVSAQFY